MSENENEKMPTRGIRMPDELWKTCIEMSEELGYHPNVKETKIITK